MPAAVLDTNAVSDLMRDHPQLKARVASASGPLVTSVVVRGEIRYGLDRLPAGKKRTALEARAQTILAALPCEPITEQVAEVYGRLKASLDSRGLALQDNDLWIAATALTLSAVLVSRDRAFASIPGLQVEDWTV
jgi:predicted nucleic acid-binding protein